MGGLQKVSPPMTKRKPAPPSSAGSPTWRSLPTSTSPQTIHRDILNRQAVVNAGVTFRFRNQHGRGFERPSSPTKTALPTMWPSWPGEAPHTPIQFWTGERTGRDRADKPEYKVKLSCAFCFCPAHHIIEHYHNSSWLEHGGAPEKAMRSAFLSAMDGWLKQNNKYNKNEAKITWPRRPGDPGPRHKLLFYPDQLRKPDQEGHQQ